MSGISPPSGDSPSTHSGSATTVPALTVAMVAACFGCGVSSQRLETACRQLKNALLSKDYLQKCTMNVGLYTFI
jgi:hypothetical protein